MNKTNYFFCYIILSHNKIYHNDNQIKIILTKKFDQKKK